MSLARAGSTSQTAAVTFSDKKTAGDFLKNSPPLKIHEEWVVIDKSLLYSGPDTGAIVE